jgi:hypothetical protein
LENTDEDRFDFLKSMLLDEEAIGQAAVFKITALQSRLSYPNGIDKHAVRNDIMTALTSRRPFSPRLGRSHLSEGFIQFVIDDSSASFYFVREAAFKWEFVNPATNTLDSQNIKRVGSTQRVRVGMKFADNELVVTFFGGLESLVYRARELVCETVRRYLSKADETNISFSLNDMQRILTAFGKEVYLLNIDPHDNERFRKIVERRDFGNPEIKREVLYDIAYFRISGVSIVKSPEVARLIKEEGIQITEIRGGLWALPKVRVTCKVKCTGRVEFNIPTRYFGTDTQVIYETVVTLFARLLSNEAKKDKGPLDYFFEHEKK